MVKHIPNILSIARIPLSISLPFLVMLDSPWPFLFVFGLCGTTDVLDGILARALNVQSKLGEKLDSAADGIAIVCYITAVLIGVDVVISPLHWALFGLLLIGRAHNMVFTWSKFRRVGFIHLRFMRWAAVAIWFLLPISVWLGHIPEVPLAILLGAVTISGFEETFILGKMQQEEYTMTLKSYWQWQRDRKQIAAESSQKNEVLV
ncbi:MAG: CDP-alcohol phosphatidyltransferase family protein [Oscillospiraceae bacterium]|nr:CDP-alcohol phosphatidyltransferase family protein [Oscillospiraceae bacterium]